MSNRIFVLLLLTLTLGCGGEDLVPTYQAWDLSYEEPVPEQDTSDSGNMDNMDMSTDVPDTSPESPEEPEESAVCKEKRRRECARLLEAVNARMVEPDLYYYLCYGEGKKLFRCYGS